MANSVLVVEDEKPLREALAIKLKKEGFQVFEAGNGKEGIEIVKVQNPKCVILDIIMPGMNGLDVLKQMKEHIGLSDIPVIVLTNLPEESAREKVKELGGTEYLVKSNTSLESLVEKVKGYLKKAEENMPKEKA